MLCFESLASSCDVEGRQVECALVLVTLGLYGNLQHLYFRLPLQHLADADVLGGHTDHFNGLLLVAFSLKSEVWLGVGTGTHVLQGHRTVNHERLGELR